ncbi:MAG: response regulator, partial [Candidatus Latescibacteria bacterium]|nr:response regulator [Candidatus Latescibacterota bacterium]
MAEEQDQLHERQPQKVLLAQSDPQDRGFTRLFLQSIGGYEVLEAVNGIGVIKQLKKRPDIILLDTVAQGGFIRALEIVRRTKALQSIPIAIYSHEQNRLPECIRKGADGFIIKPTPPGMLLGKIWKLLGEDSQRAATAAGFASKYKKENEKIDNFTKQPTV